MTTAATTTPLPRVPKPQGGASLMIALQCNNKKVLIVGNNSIASNRVLSSLEADATVYLVGPKQSMVSDLIYRIEQQQIQWLGDVFSVDFLDNNLADLVFVCETNNREFATPIVQACRARRIPINVTDANDLCDFFMTSTYRDQSLQIAVSTNGQASKLSNRIRRHVAASLPVNLGDAVRRVGLLRQKVRQSDPSSAASGRRMKWLAQICEYWSMDRLAQLSDQNMEDLLEAYHQDEGYESIGKTERLASLGVPPRPQQPTQQKQGQSSSVMKKGKITLVGAGPGDPKLLTIAAYDAIQEADLVLADKIVPAEVIALVQCELRIARKFPGNADAAQEEFNKIAVEALNQGKKVVRLKQGGKKIKLDKKEKGG